MQSTDLQPDDFKTAAELSLLLPRAPHENTWRKWRRNGLRGHRLPATQILGRWHYKLSDFLQFLELTGQAALSDNIKCSDLQQQPATIGSPTATANGVK